MTVEVVGKKVTFWIICAVLHNSAGIEKLLWMPLGLAEDENARRISLCRGEIAGGRVDRTVSRTKRRAIRQPLYRFIATVRIFYYVVTDKIGDENVAYGIGTEPFR